MQDPNQPVELPSDLVPVAKEQQLESYVQARIIQFAIAFASRINPALAANIVQRSAKETLASLPPPQRQVVTQDAQELQLVFRHDCLSLGCLDPQCVLCEHNPHRRCNVNFAPKYLVNDILKAKCDAQIRVEIIDRLTGAPITEDLPDVHLEMCILDGNAYDAKCSEPGTERDEDLDSCALLQNNKGQPLLVAGQGASHNAEQKVVIQLSNGTVTLPDLYVSDSSEALLSGRKPPFRLLVRAVHTLGHVVGSIRHAVSEGFVVATRRTRTAGKVEIPNVDDHVSKLEHMGKETVKKLQDLRGAAGNMGIELEVPENTINKVGEFRRLAILAEQDGHLRQRLQQVLKLSKEKWDEARDHALRAVVADNRMRIWYADNATMEMGLLFTCRLGNVDLDRPVGLLQKKAQDGNQTTMEATLMAQQTPSQRDQVRALQPQAVASWWGVGHPGWAIHPLDSEQFLNNGVAEPVNMPAMSPIPSPAPTPAHVHAAAMHHPDVAALANGMFPGGFGSGVVPQAAGMHAAAAWDATQQQQLLQHLAAAAQPPPIPQQAHQVQRPPPVPAQAPTTSGGFDFAAGNLSVFQSLLPGTLPGNGVSVGTLPSFPATLQSADLEGMLTPGASVLGLYGNARLPSLGKLESMDLPANEGNVDAVAMLHDLTDRNMRGVTTPRMSGLESMQSIEQSLDAAAQE